MKILLASTNKGKIKEFTEILSGPGITIVTPGDMGLSLEVEENGATFAENALLKARQWSRAAEMPVLADDSGLCVEALGGRPGVLTARFAGPGAGDKDNYRLLLSCLEDTEDRRAKFVCAVALAFADGRVVQAEGEYEGVICHETQQADNIRFELNDEILSQELRR